MVTTMRSESGTRPFEHYSYATLCADTLDFTVISLENTIRYVASKHEVLSKRNFRYSVKNT